MFSMKAQVRDSPAPAESTSRKFTTLVNPKPEAAQGKGCVEKVSGSNASNLPPCIPRDAHIPDGCFYDGKSKNFDTCPPAILGGRHGYEITVGYSLSYSCMFCLSPDCSGPGRRCPVHLAPVARTQPRRAVAGQGITPFHPSPIPSNGAPKRPTPKANSWQ